MNQQPQAQKSKRKISKGFIIIVAVIIVAILGWAGLTWAGYIPNYLNIKILNAGGCLKFIEIPRYLFTADTVLKCPCCRPVDYDGPKWLN